MHKIKIAGIIFIIFFLFLGCEEKKKEHSEKTLKFGATFPLTGDVASYGINAKSGIQMRISEFNKNNELSGVKIEVDYQDDKNSIKDAANIFNKFSTINKYPVVFGSAGSSVSLALTPIANREKTILFSPVSSSSQLSEKGGFYFFRTVPSDNLQAEILAGWIKSEKIKDVAVVYTNNSWGKPLADSFIELFSSKGGTITFIEGVPENTRDFRTIIMKLKKTEFQAIVSPTYPKEGGIFVKQLKEAGIVTRLFGGDNWGAPEFINIAGNAAENAFFTFPSDSKSPLWDNFVVKYKAEFGNDPDIISAYSYDAASAVVEAVKKTEAFTSDKIREQLLLVNFEGVSGNISFKSNGDINSQGFGKRRIVNGQAVSIY